MSIGEVGQYGGFLNSYRVSQIKSVDVETVIQQDQAFGNATSNENNLNAIAFTYTADRTVSSEADNQSKFANLQDISLTFNSSDDFDYIGKDSCMGRLDMQNAVSGMQKDQVLQEYQYFVGSTQSLANVISDSEDGVVIQK